MPDSPRVTTARPTPASNKQRSPAPKGAHALRRLAKEAAGSPPMIGHNGGSTMMPPASPTNAIRKHCYTLQELHALGYGSAPFLYEEIADGNLVATKLGRRTVVLIEHLEGWLASRPLAVSQYRVGRRKSAQQKRGARERPPRSPRSVATPAT